MVADEHDKRNRLVALTEAGWAKIAQSHPLWEKPNAVSSARSARRRRGRFEQLWTTASRRSSPSGSMANHRLASDVSGPWPQTRKSDLIDSVGATLA